MYINKISTFKRESLIFLSAFLFYYCCCKTKMSIGIRNEFLEIYADEDF